MVAIGATLAYFVSTTNKVENAFSASDGLAIDLNEHNYIQNTNQLGTDEVKANTYKDIYPNKVVPKDPFVSVDTVPTLSLIHICPGCTQMMGADPGWK